MPKTLLSKPNMFLSSAPHSAPGSRSRSRLPHRSSPKRGLWVCHPDCLQTHPQRRPYVRLNLSPLRLCLTHSAWARWCIQCLPWFVDVNPLVLLLLLQDLVMSDGALVHWEDGGRLWTKTVGAAVFHRPRLEVRLDTGWFVNKTNIFIPYYFYIYSLLTLSHFPSLSLPLSLPVSLFSLWLSAALV